MSNYILRDVPPPIWDRFRARAHADQWHMRRLFLQLMDDFGRGLITPSVGPGPSPAMSSARMECPNGHEFWAWFTKAQVLATGAPSRVFCTHCGVEVPMDADSRENLLSWAHMKSIEEPEVPLE